MKTLYSRYLTKLLLLMLITNFAIGQPGKSFHDFSTKTLMDEEYDLVQLKGKKVLVINTASKCGLTLQYEQLQAIYKKYGGDKFEIIGFPANNFAKQEPGTNEEIAAFCKKNYGVTFPMMHKISVKGKDMDPIYEWLTSKNQNGVKDGGVKWNFQKFLIDEDGKWIAVLGPSVKPDSDKIINWIENGVTPGE